MSIHPTAVIDEKAQIGADVKIGAYCVVEGEVTLADGVELKSHVVVAGRTSIGEGTVIYPFASIGHRPQDLKFKGENSELIIGKNNQIREHVTMNPGTKDGGMITSVGNNCLFMMGSHIAHDCKVGNNVILANNATLAGHVVVGDGAIIGGLSAVHQFVRIGKYAMIGGMSGIENDVIPYGSAMGERAGLSGLNLVGLKRQGFTREDIHILRNIYKELFIEEKSPLSVKVEELKQTYKENKTVLEMLEFLSADKARAVCLPKKQ